MRTEILKRSRRLILALAATITTGNTAMAAQVSVSDWMKTAVTGGDNLAIVAVVSTDGQPVFHEYGRQRPDGPPVDRDTAFEIGSVTKVFTNLLLAELVAAGKVGYDTVIADLLPDGFTFQNTAVGQITLEALATHHSGLPRLPANLAPDDPQDPYAGYDEQALLEGLAVTRALQPLGRRYAYSNLGVGLLGHLLGVVDGRGYAEALRARVLEPLGLSATGFSRPENRAVGFRGGAVVPDWTMDDALAGAGALISTAAEFAILSEALLTKDSGPQQQLLRSAELSVAETDIGFTLTRVWHVAQGEAGPVYWHNGGTGGFFSFFGYQPASQRSLALLVSGETDPTGFGLDWLGGRATEPQLPEVDSTVAGQYALTPDVGIGVFAREDWLMAQVSGQAALPLAAIGDDWYAYDTVDASLHFRREEGRVTAVELAQGGRLQVAARVAEVAEVVETLDREAVTLTAEQLGEYAGAYALGPGMEFRVRLQGSQLQAMLTGQPYLPIYPRGDDVFFYRVVDAELHFERDAAGVINALVLHQGPVKQRAVRQR